jgi:YHS domain-containing protein
MKRTTMILTLAAAMMIAAMAFAGEADEKATEKPKELKNQTHCPVMGGVIDSTVFTDIQGQRVYHCCPMCSKDLKADPDKYFKKAAKDGVVFENIQTTCPVSGEAIDKNVSLNYEGRRLYFCCEKCIATFESDPAGYFGKMDAKPTKDAATKDESKSGGMKHGQ